MDIKGLSGFDPGSSALSSKGAQYGDNPFLTLLTTQLRNQTPLEPVDNESFMKQVATFSSMEEQKALNDNMLTLLDYQGLLARMQGLSQGSALLGKEVSYEMKGSTKTGVVDSVFVNEEGDLRVKIDSGDEISMRSITGITEPKKGKS